MTQTMYVHMNKWIIKNFKKESISTNKPGVVVHTWHPSYVGCINRKIVIQAHPGKNMSPYMKNKAKGLGGGGVAKMVAYLPSKHKVPEFKVQYCQKI
jgi:hypothetical protein